MGKEETQGRNLVDAAKRMNIQHFVYSSLANVMKLSCGKYNVPHFTDKALVAEYAAKQGFPFHTFFEPAFYYQNLLTFFAPKNDDEGNLVFTLPETSSITMFDVRDTGGVVAAIFRDPAGNEGKHIAAQGYDGSLEKAFDILGRTAGEKVRLETVPTEEFAKLGFPGAEELADMFAWFNDYTYFGPNVDINSGKQLYPDITPFDRWVKSSWKPSPE